MLDKEDTLRPDATERLETVKMRIWYDMLKMSVIISFFVQR